MTQRLIFTFRRFIQLSSGEDIAMVDWTNLRGQRHLRGMAYSLKSINGGDAHQWRPAKAEELHKLRWIHTPQSLLQCVP